MISLVQELKRISDVVLADHQQMMKEKEAQKDVLQGREVQVLAQLRNVTDERDDIQLKLNGMYIFILYNCSNVVSKL